MAVREADIQQVPHLEDLKRLSFDLRDALRELVSYEPGLRPIELGRRFKVNKDTSSRVLTCCQIEDALEFAYRCPSPATLRKLVDATRDAQASEANAAARAIDEYEHHVRTEFGDQSTMNVLIGSIHPDLGQKAEAAQKQSVFRGMSHLHGVFAEVGVQVAVLTKGPEPKTMRYSWADGCLGLRRLHPGPPVVIGCWEVNRATGDREARPATNVLTDNWGKALGLDEAPGGSPWVTPSFVQQGNAVHVQIVADVLGLKNAVSYGVAEHDPSPIAIGVNESSNWVGIGQLVDVPLKLLVYDLLVEEGMFDNAPPELVMYDTAMRGTSPLFEPSREFDRLHLHERVDALPAGVAGHESADVPFMPELVRFTLESAGLEGKRFRGYRLRQTYPIYGSQIAFAFKRG